MTSLFVTALVIVGAASPQHFPLQSAVDVWDVTVEDLTLNGMKDIIALCCDRDARTAEKEMAVYLPDAKGAYPPIPSLRVVLPEETGGVFLAETDGAAPREVVAIHAGGATVYAFEDGRFVQRSQTAFSSLLPSYSREPLFLRTIAKDLDGDGVDEWLIPVVGGFEIRTPERRLAKAMCDVVSEVRRSGSFQVLHRIPACHLFEIEGQTEKGVAFLSDEAADFVYGPEWSQHKRFDIPVSVEDKWEFSAHMVDINKDGLPDLTVSQTRGTVNMEVVTQVYLAEGPLEYPAKPTARFETKGAIAAPAVNDVDGDGNGDVIFIKIPIGLQTFINFFLRQRLTVQIEVYLFDGTGFPDAPDFNQNLSIEAPEGREEVAYAFGDFNGDGRLDAAFASGAEKLVVHTGSPTQLLSRRPWAELALPAFGVAGTDNLDEGPQDDIVIFHPGMDNRKRIQVVLFEE